MEETEIKFFSTPEEFRLWLDKNHDKLNEQWVGFYKKASELASISWPESVDQALCYGWIDGLRKSIDDVSYKIRFTPRKPTSHWSDVNIKKAATLTQQKLMKPPGLEAFSKRKDEKSGQASHEQKNVVLSTAYKSRIKENVKAWKFFESKPPSYKKAATWWVMSAKKEETQLRRLEILIDCSEKEEKIPPLRWSRQ